MENHENDTIRQIENALMGVKWNSDEDGRTLFFFPVTKPGASGVLRAGDNHIVFKTPLEYQVSFKQDNAYLNIFDLKKGEVLEYRIEKLSKHQRILVIVDQSGKKFNFNYY